MLRNNADARRCSYFEFGLPVMQFKLASAQTFFGVRHAFLPTNVCGAGTRDAPLRMSAGEAKLEGEKVHVLKDVAIVTRVNT